MKTRAQRKEEKEEYEKKHRLEGMPPPVMERVMSWFDFWDINSFRRSCTYARNMVNLVKPDPRIDSVHCSFSPEAIEVRLQFWCTVKSLKFKNEKGGCLIECNTRTRDDHNDEKFFLKKTSAVETFRRDFKTFLPLIAHKKVPLQNLDWVFHPNGFPVFQETMARLLDELSLTLRAEAFHLTYEEDPQLMQLLPMVSAGTLKNLWLTDKRPQHEVLDLSQVMQLPQWKGLQWLRLDGCQLDSLEHLPQCSKCHLSYQNVSPETVDRFKEIFRSSPKLADAVISVARLRNLDEIRRVFTPTNVDQKVWYFSMSTPGFVMRVSQRYNTIDFYKVPRRELKFGDRVQD